MKKLLALLLLFGVVGCSSEVLYECGYGFNAKLSADKSQLTQIIESETGDTEWSINKVSTLANGTFLFTFGQHVYVFNDEDASLKYINRKLKNEYRPCKKLR